MLYGEDLLFSVVASLCVIADPNIPLPITTIGSGGFGRFVRGGILRGVNNILVLNEAKGWLDCFAVSKLSKACW